MTTDFLPITISNSSVEYTEKAAVPREHSSMSITPQVQDANAGYSALYSFQVSNNGVTFYDYPHEDALTVDIDNSLELPKRLPYLFIRFAVFGNSSNTGQVVFKVNYG